MLHDDAHIAKIGADSTVQVQLGCKCLVLLDSARDNCDAHLMFAGLFC